MKLKLIYLATIGFCFAIPCASTAFEPRRPKPLVACTSSLSLLLTIDAQENLGDRFDSRVSLWSVSPGMRRNAMDLYAQVLISKSQGTLLNAGGLAAESGFGALAQMNLDHFPRTIFLSEERQKAVFVDVQGNNKWLLDGSLMAVQVFDLSGTKRAEVPITSVYNRVGANILPDRVEDGDYQWCAAAWLEGDSLLCTIKTARPFRPHDYSAGPYAEKLHTVKIEVQTGEVVNAEASDILQGLSSDRQSTRLAAMIASEQFAGESAVAQAAARIAKSDAACESVRMVYRCLDHQPLTPEQLSDDVLYQWIVDGGGAIDPSSYAQQYVVSRMDRIADPRTACNTACRLWSVGLFVDDVLFPLMRLDVATLELQSIAEDKNSGDEMRRSSRFIQDAMRHATRRR